MSLPGKPTVSEGEKNSTQGCAVALVPPSCVRRVRGLGPDSGVSEVEIPVHLSETLKLHLYFVLFCRDMYQTV